MSAGLHGIHVPLGETPVMPLFVEPYQQALAHRVADGSRPSGSFDRLGVVQEVPTLARIAWASASG